MSHTLKADGSVMIGNSDWSGDVSITWLDDAGGSRSVTIPGHVFLALAKQAVAGELASVVEQAVEDWSR